MTVPFVVSLGSNLGDRLRFLRDGVAALSAHPGVGVGQVSSVYETQPWGNTDQPAFLNIVARGTTTLTPEALLAAAQSTERASGRLRGEHWGPRTLDVDLITVGSEHRATPTLTLPHPLAAERAFVLVPWLEIDALATLPGLGSVEALVAGIGAAGVVRWAAWPD